jgi:hypothetical protein
MSEYRCGDIISISGVNVRWFKVPIQGRRRKRWKRVRRRFAEEPTSQWLVTFSRVQSPTSWDLSP